MIFSTKFLTNGFFCISSYCFSILFTFNVLYVQISLELNHLYIFNKMYLLFCNFDYYFFFNVYIFQWKQIFVFYKLFLFIKYLISNWFISVWRIYLKHSLMYQRINIITNIILLYILKVSYLTDYKSRFKSHKQFKTNLIHQNFAIDYKTPFFLLFKNFD